MDLDVSTRNDIRQENVEIFQIAVPPSCFAESLGARLLDILVFVIAVAIAIAVVVWDLGIVIIERWRDGCLKKRVRVLGALSRWSPELKWHDFARLA